MLLLSELEQDTSESKISTMRVFISWSGNRAKHIATTLKDWLGDVVQDIEIFISEEIEKGKRGGDVIAQELEKSDFGVICLTPENQTSEWVNFEAGALSKKVADAHVCTFLFDMNVSQVKGPLAAFQHTRFDQADVAKMVKSICKSAGKSVSPRTVEKFWPDLLAELKKTPAPEMPRRSIEAMLQDIAQCVRSTHPLGVQITSHTNGQREAKQNIDIKGKLRELPPAGQTLAALVEHDNEFRPQVEIKIDSATKEWTANVWLQPKGKNFIHLVTPNELGMVLLEQYRNVHTQTSLHIAKKLMEATKGVDKIDPTKGIGMWIGIRMDRLPPGLELEASLELDFWPPPTRHR